jgi:hypothetical protein
MPHAPASKLATLPFAVLVVAAPFLLDCGQLKGLPGPAGDIADAAGGCDEFAAGNFGSLKADAKAMGFLEASYNFKKLTIDLEADLIASCAELGKAIGVAGDNLKGEPQDGEGAKKVCGAVSAKIDAVIKGAGSGGLTLDIQKPECFASIEALNECYSTCGAAVSPGEMSASCKGGEISGSCEGTCEGSCAVEAGAECKGACSGSCSGSCEAGFSGKCGGNCDGTCDGQNTKGKCEGTCDGKCDAKAEGSCSGTCSGTCSASCEVKGKAECKGRCEGGCKGTVKEPKCSGDFEPPKVDLSCQANCSLKTMGDVKCDPPRVTVKAKGKANADLQKLVAALQVSLPKIAAIQLGAAEKLGKAGAGVAAQGEGMVSAASSGGAKILVCLKAAIEANVSAAASVDVNVKASASVSGSAKGEAKAGG